MRNDYWGARDCAVAAADHVRAMTGRDPMADLRGLYDDARGAARILREGGGFLAVVEARIGLPRVEAGRAEVAMLPSEPWPVLAVRVGRFWASPAPDGGRTYLRVDAVTPLAAWGAARG